MIYTHVTPVAYIHVISIVWWITRWEACRFFLRWVASAASMRKRSMSPRLSDLCISTSNKGSTWPVSLFRLESITTAWWSWELWQDLATGDFASFLQMQSANPKPSLRKYIFLWLWEVVGVKSNIETFSISLSKVQKSHRRSFLALCHDGRSRHPLLDPFQSGGHGFTWDMRSPKQNTWCHCQELRWCLICPTKNKNSSHGTLLRSWHLCRDPIIPWNISACIPNSNAPEDQDDVYMAILILCFDFGQIIYDSSTVLSVTHRSRYVEGRWMSAPLTKLMAVILVSADRWKLASPTAWVTNRTLTI